MIWFVYAPVDEPQAPKCDGSWTSAAGEQRDAAGAVVGTVPWPMPRGTRTCLKKLETPIFQFDGDEPWGANLSFVYAAAAAAHRAYSKDQI